MISFNFLVLMGGVLLMSIAIGVLLLKFINLYLIRNRLDGSMPVKMFSWYNNLEVYGSDSPHKRRFMQLSNRLTGFFWAAVLLFIFLLVLENSRVLSSL